MKRYYFVGVAAIVVALGVSGFDNHHPSASAVSETVQISPQDAQELTKQRIETIRTKAEQRNLQVKQDICQRNQDKLQKTISRLTTNSEALLEAVDAQYQRLQNHYDDNQFTVADYESLQVDIDTTRSAAQVAIDATKEYEFELDCSDPGLGVQLDEFKEIVELTRLGLRDYHSKLLYLINAIRDEESL